MEIHEYFGLFASPNLEEFHSVGSESKHTLGIVIYFKYLKFLCTMFFIISVLSIPTLAIYIKGNKIKNDYLTFSQTTLGNIGQSIEECNLQPVSDEVEFKL